MNKRFMLTAAGAAATGIAGAASAAVVDWTHGLDRWAGEHSWSVTSSNGAVVASMYVSGGFITYAGAAVMTGYATFSSLTSHLYDIYGTMDLANGTYNVQMVDQYADGWAWGSYVGGLAIGSGSASFPSGSGASFNFTVVPAPSALALLGLAGLACGRRRK